MCVCACVGVCRLAKAVVNHFERSDEAHRKLNFVVSGGRKTPSLIAMVLLESLISTSDPLSSATPFTVLFSTSLLTSPTHCQTHDAYHLISELPGPLR